MAERRPKISIQRGFIAGVVAVSVISLASAFIIKNINKVDASIIGDSDNRILSQQDLDYSVELNRCQKNGILQTESKETTLTDAEKNTYGSKAKAYEIKINEKKASFRLVAAAKNIDKLGNGIAGISYALTFLNFENRNAWGGNNDRMILLLTNGQIQTDIYNTINKNETHTGSFKAAYDGTAEINLHIEFQGKNYDGCIANVLALPKDYQTDSSSESDATEESDSITIRPGFNAYSLPSNVKLLDTQALKSAGITVWAYNRLADKKWHTTSPSTKGLYHDIGYYLYNPTDVTKTIKVSASSNQQESKKDIYAGWNLLSNSNQKSQKLSEMEYYINACPPVSTNQSTCESVGSLIKLSDLFIGNKDSQKAYPVIMIIKDPYASDPAIAFEQLHITDSNLDTTEIPANKLFWIYIWPQ